MRKVVNFFETQIIENSRVWVLQCLERVDLGTLIMLGHHLILFNF
jgi:hypothetical protein